MNVQVLESNNELASLQKHWAGLTIASAALLALQFLGLLAAWPDHAWRWLGISAAGCLWLSWSLWRGLTFNRLPDSDRLLPALGPGTQLTLLRGLLLASLAGFLFSPRPPGWLAWLPGIFYTLAAIADLFDGYLARRSGQITRLGELLDLNLDGAGVLIAALLVVQYGQAPAWYLLVGFLRYLFVAWIWLRQRWGLPVYELPPSPTRRPFAGAQMGVLAVLLWPLFTPPGTHLAAALFAIPFLVGFTRDGLAVSGWTLPGHGLRKEITSEGIQTSRLSPHLRNSTCLCEEAFFADEAISSPVAERDCFASHNARSDTSSEFLPERRAPGAVGLLIRQSWPRLLTSWLPLLLRVGVVLLLVARIYTQVTALPGFSFFEGTLGVESLSPAASAQLGFLLLGLVLLALGAAGRLGALAVLFAAGFHQHLASLDLVDLLLITGGTGLFFLGTGPFSIWKPEDRIIRKRLGEA